MHCTHVDRASLTLIGGPARVGKTTLARRWTAARAVELVHLDHLLHAAAAVASGHELSALRNAPSISTHSPAAWLAQLRERDAVLWKAAKAYAEAASTNELVAEGGLWPDWVSTLDRCHTAIFIVDTGDSAERLVDIARSDPSSWMAQRQWPESKIRKWATYNRLRSRRIAELADSFGYPVFDIAGGIDDVLGQALDYLEASAHIGSATHGR